MPEGRARDEWEGREGAPCTMPRAPSHTPCPSPHLAGTFPWCLRSACAGGWTGSSCGAERRVGWGGVMTSWSWRCREASPAAAGSAPARSAALPHSTHTPTHARKHTRAGRSPLHQLHRLGLDVSKGAECGGRGVGALAPPQRDVGRKAQLGAGAAGKRHHHFVHHPLAGVEAAAQEARRGSSGARSVARRQRRCSHAAEAGEAESTSQPPAQAQHAWMDGLVEQVQRQQAHAPEAGDDIFAHHNGGAVGLRDLRQLPADEAARGVERPAPQVCGGTR